MSMRHPAISYYPLAANLKGRLAVVVGGGRVAEHKIKKLLETEAKIKVVSPLITPALKCLVSDGKITWISRIAQSSDLHSADIAVAATPSSSINKAISRWARKQGVWVNVVDNPGLSDFISPAVFRRGKALIAVYTNGMDPALSRDLKNFLKENWSVFLSYRSRL